MLRLTVPVNNISVLPEREREKKTHPISTINLFRIFFCSLSVSGYFSYFKWPPNVKERKERYN